MWRPDEPLAVATWNVLHRVHAENWDEHVGPALDDEAARIAAIAARVVERLAAGTTVVCLQEVSGDQLAVLTAALPPEARALSMRYPRVPHARRGKTHRVKLEDRTEHLVVVVGGGAPARLVEAAAFPDDHGKGFLAVELGAGLRVVDTHVTFGPKAAGQLAHLAALARGHAGPTLLLGDFNTDRATVGRALGEGFVFARPPATALPTRPRTSGSKSQDIDHVCVRGAHPLTADVLDAGGLSDHNLVEARVALGGVP